MPDLWPGETFGRTRLRAFLSGASVSGGRTVAGAMTSAHFDGGGFWRVTETCSLRSDDHVRDWGGWAAKLDSGASVVEVPIAQRVRQPSGVTGASVAAAADLRATSISLLVTGGGALKFGHRFGINHPNWGHRAYEVIEAVDGGGGSWTLTIRPPLREAAGISTVVDFADPRVCSILVNADAFVPDEDGAVPNPVGTAEWVEFLDTVA